MAPRAAFPDPSRQLEVGPRLPNNFSLAALASAGDTLTDHVGISADPSTASPPSGPCSGMLRSVVTKARINRHRWENRIASSEKLSLYWI